MEIKVPRCEVLNLSLCFNFFYTSCFNEEHFYNFFYITAMVLLFYF
jgi:hypothetical protein